MSAVETIDVGLDWVDEVARELATAAPPGCVVCDRLEATEQTIAGRRWWVCDNPGCSALLVGVDTLGRLAEIRKAGA